MTKLKAGLIDWPVRNLKGFPRKVQISPERKRAVLRALRCGLHCHQHRHTAHNKCHTIPDTIVKTIIIMRVLSLLLIIITSLFFTGIIIRTKSIFSGRKGPGIIQPMKDIFRSLRKGSVYSETSSIIFQLAPTIYFATILMAILFIPFGNQKGILSFNGDFVFFAYVLALGKFFMIIAALDTGSSFEGMGASREALYSMLVEPAFFILMGSLPCLPDIHPLPVYSAPCILAPTSHTESAFWLHLFSSPSPSSKTAACRLMIRKPTWN